MFIVFQHGALWRRHFIYLAGAGEGCPNYTASLEGAGFGYSTRIAAIGGYGNGYGYGSGKTGDSVDFNGWEQRGSKPLPRK